MNTITAVSDRRGGRYKQSGSNSVQTRLKKSLLGTDDGFTLVELVAVVVVIGLLAAIGIPVYLGAQRDAQDSAVKSDLANAKAAVVAYFGQNGPTATTPTFDGNANTGLATFGYVKSAGTTGVGFGSGGSPTPTAFCVEASSASTSHVFHIDAGDGVSAGGC